MNREGGQGLLGVGLTGRILQYQIELKIFIKFTLYREKNMGARNMYKHFQGEATPSGKSQATQGREPYKQ